MSTLSDAAHPLLQQPRARMLWLVLGALAAGQLFAIWLLCTHQVRKAEARSNEALVQQMALADCLQYVPGSTIASCSRGIDGGLQAQAVQVPAGGGAMPVSFSVR